MRVSLKVASAVVLFGAFHLPAEHLAAQSTITPYLRSVVSHYAPILIAETDNFTANPEANDHILRADFDGNNIGLDNAKHADSGVVVNGKSSAYYSIVETGLTTERGYFFINYYFYHARDAGVHFNSVIGIKTGGDHEHDLEGVMLIVRKSFGAPFGTLVAAYTQAHGALIPYTNPNSNPSAPDPAGGRVGYIRFWNDAFFGVDRPVVAIRSRKHGTYMAQDCSGKTPILDTPGGFFGTYGMWLNSPQELGTYKACIHADSKNIIYLPVPLDIPPSAGVFARRLGPTIREGKQNYELLELVTSPIWTLRNTNSLLVGVPITLFGGYQADTMFYPSGPGSEPANTPWAWRGGTGQSRFVVFGDATWYQFGTDNTDIYNDPINFPTAPLNGQLLTNPGAEAALRFPGLPYATEPFRYNPYISNAPPCCGTYLLSDRLNGPAFVFVGDVNTWSATVAGGTPPYQYHWTGAFTAITPTVTGVVQYSRTLYLDVTDAVGAHVAVSTYITVTDPNAPCGGPVAC
jgi:hypothetical protein